MSLEYEVFLKDDDIPSREAWQQAIEGAGFPCVLHAEFEPGADGGDVRAEYAGAAAGFEYYLEPAAATLSTYPKISSAIGNRLMCASFRWGGRQLEMCAGLSALAALTQLADGVYYDPQDDQILNGTEIIAMVKRELDLT